MYQLSLYIAFCFLWLCMSYIDRVHFRERCRRYGIFVHNSLQKISFIRTYYQYIRIYLLRPICTLCEMIVGFLEGVENLEAIVNISENKIQYDENIDGCVSDNMHQKILNHNVIINNITELNDNIPATPANSRTNTQNYEKDTECITPTNSPQTSFIESDEEIDNQIVQDINDISGASSDIQTDSEDNNSDFVIQKRKIPLARRRHQY